MYTVHNTRSAGDRLATNSFTTMCMTSFITIRIVGGHFVTWVRNKSGFLCLSQPVSSFYLASPDFVTLLFL